MNIVSENDMGSPLRVFQNSTGNNSPEAVGHGKILKDQLLKMEVTFLSCLRIMKKTLKRIASKYERKRKLKETVVGAKKDSF